MSDSPQVPNPAPDTDEDEQTVTTAPFLGVEIEDYEDESTPPQNLKMIALIAHYDDITADLEDEEDGEDDEEEEDDADSAVESADDDEEFTLGKFREATKDLPDTTPMVLTTVFSDEDDDSEDSDEPTETA